MRELHATGIDANWQSVRDLVAEASGLLQEANMPSRMTRLLDVRYRELAAIAARLLEVGVDRQEQVVDKLAGASGENAAYDHELALLLLERQLEAGIYQGGNTRRFQAVLPMPEQLFRVWALWALKLDYECTPPDADGIWDEVRRSVPPSVSDVQPSAEGQRFPSFYIFAYFAVAVSSRDGGDGVPAPFPSCKAIEQCTWVFDYRNQPAHSVLAMEGKPVERYLELVDQWIDVACAVAPGGGVPRDRVKSYVEALPTPG